MYYVKKGLALVIALITISFVVFFMARLSPGDPIIAYYGDRAERMTAEERQQTIERLNLDKPIYQQYITWVKNALKGDFGISYKYKENVLKVVSDRVGNTLILGISAYILTFLLAVLVGILCAVKEGGLIDKFFCQLGTVTSCIPSFWLSLLLILIFSVFLSVLPSSGAYALGKSGDIGSRVTHLVLPLAVLVISHLWYYAYMIRNKFLEEIKEDYVLLARAKGMSRAKVIFKHCFKNVLPSLISIMAVSVSHIIGGTYIVEMVFSYPGLGMLSFESAKYHDYNTLMVLCLITGAAVIISGMMGEIISECLDPRMKDSKIIQGVIKNG